MLQQLKKLWRWWRTQISLLHRLVLPLFIFQKPRATFRFKKRRTKSSLLLGCSCFNCFIAPQVIPTLVGFPLARIRLDALTWYKTRTQDSQSLCSQSLLEMIGSDLCTTGLSSLSSAHCMAQGCRQLITSHSLQSSSSSLTGLFLAPVSNLHEDIHL